MDDPRVERRRFVRAVGAGAVAALAGCSDPEGDPGDDDGDGEDGGGAYREDGSSADHAGTSAGGSSAG